MALTEPQLFPQLKYNKIEKYWLKFKVELKFFILILIKVVFETK